MLGYFGQYSQVKKIDTKKIERLNQIQLQFEKKKRGKE